MKTCPSCGETKDRATAFGRRTNGYSKSYCRVCEAAATRARYARRGPDTGRNRRAQLRRYFGLTEDDYAAMSAAQHHRCAICGRDEGARGRRLFVDHCHATGRIRGLLCSSCNTGIGMLQDDVTVLLEAVAYLRRMPDPDARYVPSTCERA